MNRATLLTQRGNASRPARMQSGMAIMTAIFILIVLAVLAAFVVQVSTMQHMGSIQDLQSIRTYQAARAGIEWGLFRVQPANAGSCASASGTFTPVGDTFSGITVKVEAAAGGNTNFCEIRSTACYQPAGGACPNTGSFDSNYIERRIDVRLRTDMD